MTIADLLAELAVAPRLDGALCRGHSELFDPAERGDDTSDTAERLAYAVRVCRHCPALDACRRWFDSLPLRQRPRGVTAGFINGKEPQRMTEQAPMTASEPATLHRCGPRIPTREYGEVLGASVLQYPGNMPVVALESTDGDGGQPNMWWELTPGAAVELADQLLHHAEVARDFLAQVN